MAKIQKITPCLWFNGNAEKAVKHYTSIFKNSRIKRMSHYGKGGMMKEGTVLSIDFQLAGQDFIALNGGVDFPFSEAISLTVYCDTQTEIDYFWRKLIAGGGKPVQCGWLTDKFGLSWQILPADIPAMISGDHARRDRVMDVVLKSIKLDIAALKRAYDGPAKMPAAKRAKKR